MQRGALIRAEIYIQKTSRSAVELIAHELEHVIEQLDGVHLFAASEHGVFRSATDAFETKRAIHVGELVERQFWHARGEGGL